jgi:LmbE family N-acetylglucosaminyl deacetylase
MDLARPLLGVFAHPDDEVFSMGGTAALAAAQGAPVQLLTLTHGERGVKNLPRALPADELARLREAELRESCRLLGARPPLLCGYPDGGLDQADPEEVIARILRLVEEFRPATLITFGPDGATGHRDHVAVGRLATEAWRRSLARGPGAPALYWAARPASLRQSFRARITARPRTEGHYHEDPPAVPYRDEELESMDVSSVVEQKRAAARAHASQAISRLPDPGGTPSEWWGVEYFYRVPR